MGLVSSGMGLEIKAGCGMTNFCMAGCGIKNISAGARFAHFDRQDAG